MKVCIGLLKFITEEGHLLAILPVDLARESAKVHICSPRAEAREPYLKNNMGGENQPLRSCLLTFTYAVWHVHTHL